MINKRNFKVIIAFIALLILIKNPQTIILAVKNSLIICYEKIIPSLFPFMVLSAYVSQSSAVSSFAVPFGFYSRLIKINDRKFSCYLFLSILGGFAVGSQMISRLSKDGYSQKALQIASVAMISNSFSFVCFAVGIGLLGNYRLGLMIFAALTLSGLISAFLLSFLVKYNIVSQAENSDDEKISFTSAVHNSVNSILTICGFVIIFYCICEVIMLYFDNLYMQMVLCALSEVTSGCVKAVSLFGKNPYILCCVLSIFPVSTLCQTKAFAGESVDILFLLKSRIIHLPLSCMLLSVFINIFPVSANVYSNSDVIIRSYWNSVSISFTMFVICFVFVILFDKNKLFTKKE